MCQETLSISKTLQLFQLKLLNLGDNESPVSLVPSKIILEHITSKPKKSFRNKILSYFPRFFLVFELFVFKNKETRFASSFSVKKTTNFSIIVQKKNWDKLLLREIC